MKLKIFCIRDRATGQHGTPMFLISEAQAIRSFKDEVNRPDKDNQLYQHPDDFDLHALGEYESSSGEFETHSPLQIVTGTVVKIVSN